jgi:hypothetical protein
VVILSFKLLPSYFRLLPLFSNYCVHTSNYCSLQDIFCQKAGICYICTPLKKGGFGMWRSPVAHLYGVQGVAGSNPVIPTKPRPGRLSPGFFLPQTALKLTDHQRRQCFSFEPLRKISFMRQLFCFLIMLLFANSLLMAQKTYFAVRKNGVVSKNATAFFPLGFYDDEYYNNDSLAAHVRVIGKAGFNLFFMYPRVPEAPDAQIYKAARENGVYIMHLLNTTLPFKTIKAKMQVLQKEPALMGFSVGDDIHDGQWKGFPANVDDVKKIYDTFRKFSPKSVFKVALGGGEEQRQTFSKKRFDIAAQQIYPVNGGSPISLVYQAIDSVSDRAAKWGQSPWAALQCFRWPDKPNQRMPTPAELRNMTFQAIAAGAKGIIYYSYHNGEVGCDKDPDAWKALQSLVPELKAITPFLLFGKANKQVLGKGLFASTWSYKRQVLVLLVHAGDYRTKQNPADNEKDDKKIAFVLPTIVSKDWRILSGANAGNGFSLSDGQLKGNMQVLDVAVLVLGK